MENKLYHEDDWDELLDGKTVAMSPRPAVNHGKVVENIYSIFRRNFKDKQCTAFSDGYDVYLTENDRVVPDVMVVCDKNIIKNEGIRGVPDLIVEVLSPSTARTDKGYKKRLYGKCGVKEYWIVDINNKTVEIYIQRDGVLEFEDSYSVLPDYIFNKMNDEDKKTVKTEFNPHIFPGVKISLHEIFENIFFIGM